MTKVEKWGHPCNMDTFLATLYMYMFLFLRKQKLTVSGREFGNNQHHMNVIIFKQLSHFCTSRYTSRSLYIINMLYIRVIGD